MNLPKLSFLNYDDTKIPIPDPTFLREELKPIVAKKTEQKELTKHEKAYEAFCQWAALPESRRKPTTIIAFEKKYGLPQGYTLRFREREDYQDKRLRYFWEDVMDKIPEFVESVYRGSIKGNTSHAKIFAEIIAKRLDAGSPKRSIQPFMILGVPQEKIDKLFIPQTYENVEDIIPEK